MSLVAAQKSRILAGDFSLSAKVSNVALAFNNSMLEVTTLADTAKAYVSGQNTSTWAFDGYYDELDHADGVAWPSTGNPITYAPQGLTIGNEVWMASGLESSFEEQAPNAGVVGFKLAAQTDGPTTQGVALHDLGAETAGANYTSVNGSAATTGGAVAHLHVTAFSGFTNVVVTIEDSANNSTFATIGTFTTVTGATTQRLAIAGTVRQYTRAVLAVTGSGSVTFAVALSRL